MRARARIFVGFVLLSAIGWTELLYLSNPDGLRANLWDAVLLAGLAIAAEGLTFLLPRSAKGSMAFIPYFALALAVPTWLSVVAVAVVRVILEVWFRRELTKAIFNVSVHALMEAIAVTMYVTLGGVSLLHLSDIAHLTHVTRAVGAQALLASAAALMTNNFLV